MNLKILVILIVLVFGLFNIASGGQESTDGFFVGDIFKLDLTDARV